MAQLLLLLLDDERRQIDGILQAAHNYAERGMSAHIFTARLDGRAGGRVASRIGIEAAASWFDPETDFWKLLSTATTNCILIDEAQFLTQEQVRQARAGRG